MEKIIDVKYIAEVLNIPIRSVYPLIQEGKIKSFRVGRLIRVREVDFENYILDQLNQREHDSNIKTEKTADRGTMDHGHKST